MTTTAQAPTLWKLFVALANQDERTKQDDQGCIRDPSAGIPEDYEVHSI